MVTRAFLFHEATLFIQVFASIITKISSFYFIQQPIISKFLSVIELKNALFMDAIADIVELNDMEFYCYKDYHYQNCHRNHLNVQPGLMK